MIKKNLRYFRLERGDDLQFNEDTSENKKDTLKSFLMRHQQASTSRYGWKTKDEGPNLLNIIVQVRQIPLRIHQ